MPLGDKMEWLRPDLFTFENAPLNKPWQPLLAVFVYLVAIRLLERRALIHGVPLPVLALIRQAQTVHNLALSVASLIMVAGQAYTSIGMLTGRYPSDPDSRQSTFLSCSLSPAPATGRLWYWVYLFYLSKYWELLDTILQMTKGRRPPSYYFHVWHHTLYLVICYFYCAHRASLAPLAVMINGTVHIVMYYYYHLNCRGIIPWWKAHITKMQIVQFIIGYCFLFHTVKLSYFDYKPCGGQRVLVTHAIFNLTMLIGFINILRRVTKTQVAVLPSAARKLK